MLEKEALELFTTPFVISVELWKMKSVCSASVDAGAASMSG